jgi:hypothetical protein
LCATRADIELEFGSALEFAFTLNRHFIDGMFFKPLMILGADFLFLAEQEFPVGKVVNAPANKRGVNGIGVFGAHLCAPSFRLGLGR